MKPLRVGTLCRFQFYSRRWQQRISEIICSSDYLSRASSAFRVPQSLGCPLVAWRPCHAFVGQPSDIVSGQICVLGYFLERAGTPPYTAPQRGQVRSIVALSDFICNPPAVVQRCEKNTLIKTKTAVTLKASPNIRTARQAQWTLFMHNVHESRSAHCLAREVPYRQF